MAEGIERNAISQMSVFSRKWFPGREVDSRSMGEAIFLEKDYWEKMRLAVQSGISMAFKG
ncbi:MAG: hypothetical protein WBB23_06965 [Desulforhopalus sp.]